MQACHSVLFGIKNTRIRHLSVVANTAILGRHYTMSNRRSGRDDRSRERGPPPGYWHTNNTAPRDRSRSRELPRHREGCDPRQDMNTDYERYMPDPRRLIADLGPQRLANHALECLRLLSPLPSELRKVAYGVPPGIHVRDRLLP